MPIPCPACGFLTLTQGFYGSYGICGVCGWEDDGVQLANPACGGGANRESLIEAQAIALERYPAGTTPVQGVRRAGEWRPLHRKEVARAHREREQKPWKNHAVFDAADAYWCSPKRG